MRDEAETPIDNRRMSDRNGVPADDALALDEVVEDACRSITGMDPERLFETVKGLEVAVGTGWSDAGKTLEYAPTVQVFASAEAFQEQLRERTRAARVVAFPALAVLDPARAAPLFARTIGLAIEKAHQVSFEANVFRGLWLRWQELGAYLPAATFAELFLRGRFSLSSLTDEQIAAIPTEPLLEAIYADRLPYPGSGEAERLARVHPAFADLDARGVIAGRLASIDAHFARSLFPLLIASLIEARHPSTEATVLAFLERTGPELPYAVSLVIAIDHRATLERLFGEAPQRIAALAAAGALPWDPYHAISKLAPSIRAGFALDPASSSARLGPYLTPEAVSTIGGAKVAMDILCLGEGRLVDHGGTRLGTGDGDVIAADRGWAPIAARLANHPLLGPTAQQLVKLTADDPAALVAQTALPAETWADLAPKPKGGARRKPQAKPPAKKRDKASGGKSGRNGE